MNFQKLVGLLKLKLKFATSSLVATLVDYGLYLVLVATLFNPEPSHIISASIGMLINFVLQKRYIFSLNRKLSLAFGISLLTSIIGIGIGTYFIHLLTQIEFFDTYQMITKALVTGSMFFYNFYMKRFAFENKFI
jgi:putative flippase GtrA